MPSFASAFSCRLRPLVLFLLPVVPLLCPQPAVPAETALAHVLEEKLTEPFDGDLDALVKRGYIRALTPFSKSGYFVDKGEQRGISVDLMTEFSKYLDKTLGRKARDLKIVMVPTPRDRLFEFLAANRGDIALGNLTITGDREKLAAFSTPVLKNVREVPVTSDSAADMTSPEDLSGKTVRVRKSASYYSSLLALNGQLEAKGKQPVTLVIADERLEDEDLLELVASGASQMAIVDEHKADLWIEVLKGLKKHPDAAVRTDGEIAFAVRRNAPALLKEVNAFATTIEKGTLLGNIIFKRYLKEADYLRTMREKDYETGLSGLQGLFQKYAGEYNFDWLLIAAQSFQESRFDPKAHNPTGATGLMQIKPSTAKGEPINIDGSESDPEKNVHAGVKYLRYLADHYFDGLAANGANQTFFALAAYNAGPARFDRMRKSAEKHGYDPDKWFGNVEWIVARDVGRQPVDYVGNIYQYYIVFDNERDRRQARLATNAPVPEATAPK